MKNNGALDERDGASYHASMTYDKDTWKIIAAAGRRFGVNEEAIRKWRQRGIPYRWHLRIEEATQGQIKAIDLLKLRNEP